MRERVAAMCVGTQLGDDHVRSEAPHRRHDLGDERVEQLRVTGMGEERYVQREASSLAFAGLSGGARAREDELPGFVHRRRQYVRAFRECGFDAVPVVGVDIDVGDAEPGMPSGGAFDGDHAVVVDAEAGRPAAPGVVQAAGGGERPRHTAAQHRFDGGDGCAGSEGRRLVHSHESGGVSRADPVLAARHGRVGRGGLHVRDVLGVVGKGEV